MQNGWKTIPSWGRTYLYSQYNGVPPPPGGWTTTSFSGLFLYILRSTPNGYFWGCMSKHTKRQLNEFCFPTCVLLPCLSAQFAYYFFSHRILKARSPGNEADANEWKVRHARKPARSAGYEREMCAKSNRERQRAELWRVLWFLGMNFAWRSQSARVRFSSAHCTMLPCPRYFSIENSLDRPCRIC